MYTAAPSPHRWIAVSIAVGLVSFAVPEARAELFRCERPDGSVTFTDSQASCPGAKPHVPSGSIQNVDVFESTRRSATPSTRRLGPAPPGAEQMAEAQWRNKKRQVEQELEAIDREHSEYEPYLRICNRGGYLYMTQDNGLKKQVSCSSVRRTLAQLETRRASLHDYLENGLPDECRRAGCLPGWLR